MRNFVLLSNVLELHNFLIDINEKQVRWNQTF